MSFLKMRNINKIYPGNVQAVFDFNLDANEGDFIVLVGPSGCGKSTVLRMIAGLEEISSGEMYLANERINDLAPSDRDVAMVFQDYALYGNMTVYQNIGFSLMMHGAPANVLHDRVMGISQTVELYDYLNRYPKALSGGQKQRVAMGRALAKYARVLLMDEPLSNLDAKLRQQTRMELSLLHNRMHPTVLYVTHDQIEAMTLATLMVVMNEGRIQQVGTPYDIYHAPENIFTASFIGMPPINFINGRIEGGVFTGFHNNIEVLKCDVPKKIAEKIKTPKDIILGVRPEALRVLQTGKKATDEECVFSGNAETVEYLGAEYNVSVNLNGCIITCRIPVSGLIRHNQKLDVCFNLGNVHFFEKESGLRVKGEDNGKN